jgi:GNAT superfamily N-acetyltransferase
MRARILSPEEWQRMEGPQIPPLIPYVSPENIHVLVVEDKGRIVACLTVLQATHFEGLWIDPEHRNAGVSRSLLTLATALAEARGEKWVFGGADSEQMRGFLGRLGAKQVPMELYALWIGGNECLPQQ